MNNTLTFHIYQKKYEEYLKRLDERRDDITIYVTDLVGCYEKFAFNKKIPFFNYNDIFLHGDLIHEGITKILKDIFGDKVEFNKTLTYEDTFPCKFRLKGVPDIIHHDWKEIIEIKSIVKIPQKPLEHHIKQLALYLALYEATEGKEYNGRLVYISRDDFKEYVFDFRNLLGRLKGEGYIASEIDYFISNKPCPRYEWECNYCPYREICQIKNLKAFNTPITDLTDEEED